MCYGSTGLFDAKDCGEMQMKIKYREVKLEGPGGERLVIRFTVRWDLSEKHPVRYGRRSEPAPIVPVRLELEHLSFDRHSTWVVEAFAPNYLLTTVSRTEQEDRMEAGLRKLDVPGFALMMQYSPVTFAIPIISHLLAEAVWGPSVSWGVVMGAYGRAIINR
ncbi:MAG: hypothetical protein EXS55_02650 [Candidatus Magasanikbacteria bacterium]|nr:hypothetical protein [Candidatus Magasanikbacteria bacterium]